MNHGLSGPVLRNQAARIDLCYSASHSGEVLLPHDRSRFGSRQGRDSLGKLKRVCKDCHEPVFGVKHVNYFNNHQLLQAICVYSTNRSCDPPWFVPKPNSGLGNIPGEQVAAKYSHYWIFLPFPNEALGNPTYDSCDKIGCPNKGPAPTNVSTSRVRMWLLTSV